MKHLHFALLLLIAALFGCNKDDDSLTPEEQLQVDIEIIQTYLGDNNLTAQSTASGLHYIIEEEGTGEHPTEDKPVMFRFSGFFTDNNLWAESFYGPEIFSLSETLPGFLEGIPLFKVGGKGKLLLPSALAFGKEGTPTVPAHTVMIFDVELPDMCTTDTTFAKKQACLDAYKIGKYLDENNLTADSSASGLQYIIEEEGIGNALPTLNDEVEVIYTGYLLDGTVFDGSGNAPAKFPLSGVIQGWQEGIRLFKKEGKGKLFIPSALAYGVSPPSAVIPPNAVLVF